MIYWSYYPSSNDGYIGGQIELIIAESVNLSSLCEVNLKSYYLVIREICNL